MNRKLNRGRPLTSNELDPDVKAVTARMTMLHNSVVNNGSGVHFYLNSNAQRYVGINTCSGRREVFENTGAFVFMLIGNLDKSCCECPRLTPTILSRKFHV